MPTHGPKLDQDDDTGEPMTSLMEKALATVQSWPEARQDEAAKILLALDRLGTDVYRAEADELQGTSKNGPNGRGVGVSDLTT